MQATVEWLRSSGAGFGTSNSGLGCAHLRNYTAEFFQAGQGQPLVLIPGLAGGCELLGPLAKLLAERFRVISYQLRGENDCFAMRSRFGLRDLVEDLAEFIAWQRLERPALLGVSFGGVLALEFAAAFPNRLRALAVQGVGSRFENSLLQQVAGTVLSSYPLPQNSPFVNQFFNLFFGRALKPGPLVEFVTRQCWQTDQGVMAHRYRMVEEFDINERLGAIRAPTLIMRAERDLLVSESSARELKQGIEGSKLVHLGSGGHLAFVTQPENVARETLRFLDN